MIKFLIQIPWTQRNKNTLWFQLSWSGIRTSEEDMRNEKHTKEERQTFLYNFFFFIASAKEIQ